MKAITALFALALTSMAFADSVTLSNSSTRADINGVMKGASSEIFAMIADAHKNGYKLDNAADVFDQLSTPHRVGGSTLYTNKLLSAKVQSGITLSYEVMIKTKKGEMSLKNNVLTFTGEAAKLLLGAMAYARVNQGPRPLGMSIQKSPSGKVVCSRPVRPRALTTCVIKL